MARKQKRSPIEERIIRERGGSKVMDHPMYSDIVTWMIRRKPKPLKMETIAQRTGLSLHALQDFRKKVLVPTCHSIARHFDDDEIPVGEKAVALAVKLHWSRERLVKVADQLDRTMDEMEEEYRAEKAAREEAANLNPEVADIKKAKFDGNPFQYQAALSKVATAQVKAVEAVARMDGTMGPKVIAPVQNNTINNNNVVNFTPEMTLDQQQAELAKELSKRLDIAVKLHGGQLPKYLLPKVTVDKVEQPAEPEPLAEPETVDITPLN